MQKEETAGNGAVAALVLLLCFFGIASLVTIRPGGPWLKLDLGTGQHPTIFLDAGSASLRSLIRNVVPGAQVILVASDQNDAGFVPAGEWIDAAMVTTRNPELEIGILDRSAGWLQQWVASYSGAAPQNGSDIDLFFYGCDAVVSEIGEAVAQVVAELTQPQRAEASGERIEN